jgi:hypothetical protein
VQDRLLALSELDPQTGCRIWRGSTNNRGYGVIYMDGGPRLAHRVAFYLRHGRWPADGLVTDHVCENKACVNADHLREIENWRNLRRAYPRGNATAEHRRQLWRAANARRRSYSASYQLGGG